jgi:hypothetical protein
MLDDALQGCMSHKTERPLPQSGQLFFFSVQLRRIGHLRRGEANRSYARHKPDEETRALDLRHWPSFSPSSSVQPPAKSKRSHQRSAAWNLSSSENSHTRRHARCKLPHASCVEAGSLAICIHGILFSLSGPTRQAIYLTN